METKSLAILMFMSFTLTTIFLRVIWQLVLTGRSGIHTSARLKNRKEKIISWLFFGSFGLQGLLALAYAMSMLPTQLEVGSLGLLVGVSMTIGGLVLTSFSQFSMGENWRIGVDPEEQTKLVTTGIYAKIRNPIYSACLIYAWGMVLLVPHIAMLFTGISCCGSVLAYVKLVEEPYLLSLHGDSYHRYRKKTGAFLPRFN